jgi:hypothetical protein
MICNNRFDASELACSNMTMPHRLFVYLAILLVALMPLEASYAAVGCAPMGDEMAISHEADDCGGCADGEREQCRSVCLALCQLLPPARGAILPTHDISLDEHLPFDTAHPLLMSSGPEPPPPRLGR